MKLKNKKTGEIADLSEGFIRDTYNGEMIQIKPVAISNKEGYVYNSLAELNEEWEDYEESKEHWCITMYGGITRIKDDEEPIDDLIEIGNYFNSKEDAYDALEKLKAWKRLKDKCFRFYRWNKGSLLKSLPNTIEFACDDTEMWTWEDIQDDLNLLFGGKE